MPANERLHWLEKLLDLNRDLSAAQELEPFLHSIITVASELTHSDVASILELGDEGNHLLFVAVPWLHHEALKTVKVPLENSIAGWVFQNAKALIVDNVATDSRHHKAADQATNFTTHSILAVPIIYHGETLGVLEAVNKKNRAHYTEEDLKILESLASQAAVAMQSVSIITRARKSYEELAQLDRMKSDFIAITSHELRTPLGLILGHATFLHDVVGEKYRPQLDIIIRNTMRLKEIIENISNMDNFERGMASLHRRSISMVRIAEEVVNSFQEEANKKGIALTIESGKNEMKIEGDASKIAVALSNLVRNAITFTDPGGHVSVVAKKASDHIKVSVIDDGIGIPAKDLPRIFERFYQVESHLTRRHGGMGLGLSIAKAMVEMHGGRIWAESAKGKGSNFTFLLPLGSAQIDSVDQVTARR